jgi:hypothetical protein
MSWAGEIFQEIGGVGNAFGGFGRLGGDLASPGDKFGVDDPAQVCDRRFPASGRKAPPRANLQSFDASCLDRLIGRHPKDQHGDSGAQARGYGAHATVVHDRAAGRKDGRVIHCVHHLEVVGMGDLTEVSPAGADQRPPAQLRAGRADHGARVSAGDLTGVLPNPKKIGGVPAAIHDATSPSASVVNSIVSAPTKGRWPFHFAHSAASPGKQTSSPAWISSDPRPVIRRGAERVALA